MAEGDIPGTIIIEEDEMENLIKELDIDAIRENVFNLYEINYGIDTQLSLRKVQVFQEEDHMFTNYLECLEITHDRFLRYIFSGHKFQKMEQNPLHSKDLNHGVPPYFCEMLDQLLDDTHAVPEEQSEQTLKKK